MLRSLFSLNKLGNFVAMAINIGEKVKLRAKQLRIGPTELGKLINTSKQNVYGIYKRKSLDTETLRKLSAALDYDFFEYYRIVDEPHKLSDPPVKYERGVPKTVPYKDFLKLRTELDNLKEKYELLKKVNDLLEKRGK